MSNPGQGPICSALLTNVGHGDTLTPVSDPGSAWSVPQWTLGWRLQRALAHADMKAEAMAEELGVDRRTLSRWMHDKGPVRAAYLKQWALRTGVSYDWLAHGIVPTGTDEPSHQPLPASARQRTHTRPRLLAAVA